MPFYEKKSPHMNNWHFDKFSYWSKLISCLDLSENLRKISISYPVDSFLNKMNLNKIVSQCQNNPKHLYDIPGVNAKNGL